METFSAEGIMSSWGFVGSAYHRHAQGTAVRSVRWVANGPKQDPLVYVAATVSMPCAMTALVNMLPS